MVLGLGPELKEIHESPDDEHDTVYDFYDGFLVFYVFVMGFWESFSWGFCDMRGRLRAAMSLDQ